MAILTHVREATSTIGESLNVPAMREVNHLAMVIDSLFSELPLQASILAQMLPICLDIEAEVEIRVEVHVILTYLSTSDKKIRAWE